VCSSALAGLTHPLLRQFGSFSKVQSVAVDQESGDVFVYDSGASEVYKFTASGAPAEFSSTKTNSIAVPGGAGANDGEIAVDSSSGPAKGDIYLAVASRTEAGLFIFDEAGERIGELLEPLLKYDAFCGGVAVDPSGNVYVSIEGDGLLDKYVPSANPVTEADYVSKLSGVPSECNVVVDSRGDVYMAGEEGPVKKYEPDQFNTLDTVPAIGTTVSKVGSTVAVESSTNDLYVDEVGRVTQFTGNGEEVDTFADIGAGLIDESYGVAVDESTHDVYVANGAGRVNVYGPVAVTPGLVTEPPAGAGVGSVKLEGEVNPEGLPVTVCEFEYGSSTAYGQRVPCETNPGSGDRPVRVTAKVSGLVPLGEYHTRLVAGNENGSEAGSDVGFLAPLGPPTVEDESVVDVTAESAGLRAQVNPEGAVTTYRFEYGTSEAYGQSTPESPIGGGDSTVPTTEQIQGLQPGTTYHYRVVARSGVEQTYGPDQTFTTEQNGRMFTLLDGREYEMVSPPAKEGAQIEGFYPEFAFVEASPSGDAMTYGAWIPTEADPLGSNYSVQVLSTRGGGDSSWQTRDLTVPHSEPVGSQYGAGQEYRSFSSDLSHAIVQPVGTFTPCENAEGISQPCLSPEASEQTAFLTTNFSGGNVEEACLPRSMQCAQPLVSGCPQVGLCPRIVEEHADVPPGTVFGGRGGGDTEADIDNCLQNNGVVCGPEFIAATPDLSHVLIRAAARLTPEAPVSSGSERQYLYEWSGGRLQYVGEEGGFPLPEGSDPISADGSRVLFGVKGASEWPLLMRDTAAGETVEIGESGAETQFEAASSDFSRVFFRPQPLGVNNKEGGLDVFEVTSAPGEPLAGRVTSLTDGADILGYVLGVSEDGSYVYFVSEGVLAGSGASSPGANLYVDHYNGSGWKPTFIAALAPGDSKNWAQLRARPARVSPNGQWLAFMSEASLTGYDNRDAVNGRPDAEVYLYRAGIDDGAGSLTCASCEPTGARPSGTVGIQGWQQVQTDDYDDYQSRYLSDSGRLFFDATGALVPDDVNGTGDVYEYEPEGVGDCGPAVASGSVVFEAARGFEAQGHRGVQGAGCVGLISSGTSSLPSGFLDASESGGDVFFLTAAKLASQDVDDAYDVYDAHECTGVSPCSSVPVGAPACETEASCRTSPTPQPSIYNAPPSATFNGPGNVTPTIPPGAPPVKKIVGKKVKCGKGHVKSGHGKCVTRARKKAKKAQKPGKASRRAGR
jgi:hypothetical protein